MSTWNSDLYQRYKDERTRPAREPLGCVPLDAWRCVIDLGRSPGHSTELQVQRHALAYGPQADGRLLMAFPSLLIAARRPE